MSEFVMALTTVPAKFDAVKLAEQLVNARVAACVNVLPAVQSVYTWEGATEVAVEQQLFMKATRAQVPRWTTTSLPRSSAAPCLK